MKVYGLMADVHLHNWSAFSSLNPDGQNSRLVGLLNEIIRCAEEVQSAGGEVVVIAGDWFHVRGSVQPSVLNAAKDCLKLCNQRFGTQFIVLAGNHDIEHRDTTRLGSAVTALECDHVQVVNKSHYFGKDFRVVMVPWIENIDALKAEIESLGTGDMPKFFRANTDLILHAPIDGVIKGLPDHGLTPEWLADTGYKRVFAGHYHNHKRFDGNVFSIGALAHHTWSDISSKAGYLLVYHDRVDWRKSHLPEFIDLAELADLEPDELPLVVDGNFIRVKVEASKSKDVEAARQELLDMGARAVIVQALPKPPAREGSAIRPTVSAGGSLEISVSNFVSAMFGGAVGGQCAAVTKAAFDVLAAVDVAGE